LIDEAIAIYPALKQLLTQGMDEAVNWQQSTQRLQQVIAMRQQLQNQMQQQNSQPPALADANQNRF
jgi:flagellum-specific ATP synthase